MGNYIANQAAHFPSTRSIFFLLFAESVFSRCNVPNFAQQSRGGSGGEDMSLQA